MKMPDGWEQCEGPHVPNGGLAPMLVEYEGGAAVLMVALPLETMSARDVWIRPVADVENSEHPWCITGADFVKALMGIVEPRTDKEVEAWLRDLRGE